MRLRYVLQVPHRAVVPISVLHDVLHDPTATCLSAFWERDVIPAARVSHLRRPNVAVHSMVVAIDGDLVHDRPGAGLVVVLPDIL